MFSFQGRSGRGEYVLTVITTIVLLGLVGGGYYYITLEGGLSKLSQMYFGGAVALATFFSIVSALLFVSGSVRRYHDRGKSGMWALLIPTGIGIPVVLAEGLLMKGVEGQNQYDCPPGTSVAKTEAAPVSPEIKEEPKQEQKSESVPVAPEVTAATVVETKQPEAHGEPVKEEIKEAPPETPQIEGISSKEAAPAPASDVTPIPATAAVPEAPQQEDKKEAETLKEEKPVEVPNTNASTASGIESLKTENPADPSSEPAPYTIPPVRSMSEMLAELERLSKENPAAKKAAVPPEGKPPITKEAIASVAMVEPKIEAAEEPKKETPAIPKIKFGPGMSDGADAITMDDTPVSATGDDLTKNLNSIMEGAKDALSELPEDSGAILPETPAVPAETPSISNEASVIESVGTGSFSPKSQA